MTDQKMSPVTRCDPRLLFCFYGRKDENLEGVTLLTISRTVNSGITKL